MRQVPSLLVLVLLVLVTPASGEAQSVSALLRQAEAYKVEELHRPEKMRRHLNLYRQALETAPNSYEAAWKGARTALYVWRMTADEGDKRTVASAAVEMARRAQTINPQGAEGHFFVGMTLQAYAVSVGVLNVLQATPQIKSSLERALELDPDLFYGAPHMYLGLMYHLLPGFPLSIGSRQAALEHMEKAIAARPHSPIRLMYYGDILRSNRRFDEATKVLDSIVWEVRRDAERSVYESDFVQLPIAKVQVEAIRKLIDARKGGSDTSIYDRVPDEVVRQMLGL